MPVGQSVQDGVQTLKIAWYHDRSPLNIFGTFVKRRDQNASSLRRNAIKGLCHERRADNTQYAIPNAIRRFNLVHLCPSMLLFPFAVFYVVQQFYVVIARSRYWAFWVSWNYIMRKPCTNCENTRRKNLLTKAEHTSCRP